MVPMDENNNLLPSQSPGLPEDAAWTAADEAWLQAWDKTRATQGQTGDAGLGPDTAAFAALAGRLARVPLPEVAPQVRDQLLAMAQAELADDPLEAWEDNRAGTPWSALRQRVAAAGLPSVSPAVRDTVVREAAAAAELAGATDDAFLQMVATARAENSAAVGEAAQIARMQQRIATLPLPEVSPAVRSAVLGAAIQMAEGLGQVSQPAWKRWLAALLQPAPMAVGGLALALAVAVAIRPEQQAPQAQSGAAEIAAAAPASAEVAVAAAPVADAVKAGAVEQVAVAAAPVEAAPAAVAAAYLPERPQRAIAANPASLGPQVAVPAAKPQVAAAMPGVAGKREDVAQAANVGEAQPAQGENLARNVAPTAMANADYADKYSGDDTKRLADQAGIAAAAPVQAPRTPQAAKAEIEEQESVAAARDSDVAASAKTIAALRAKAESQAVGIRGAALTELLKAAELAGDKATATWAREALKADLAAAAAKKAAPVKQRASTPSYKNN